MKDFEFIEHTADIGIRIYANTLEELFKNAAQGLFSIMLDYEPKPEIEERIVLETEDLEELLITWLNELISLFITYKFVPLSYSIVIEEEEDQKILKSFIKGATLDCQKHRLKAEVKAATYHSLKIEKLDTGYVAEVIFDV